MEAQPILSTVRTYNGLLPSKFSNGPKGVSGARFLSDLHM